MKRLLIGLLAFVLAGCSTLASSSIGNSPNRTGQPSAGAPPDPSGAPTRGSTSTVQPGSPEPAIQPVQVELEDYGPAPEFENKVWLNTDQPLRLADLRGKVVLVDMWTFGCINCQHVIPSIRSWYEKYNIEGLVVIGNHYPEFSYEADLDNLKEAMVRLNVPYPVAQDNEGKTWSAYDNHYWPALFLIDKQGDIRYRHIGEGAYEETEAAIQALLAETYP